MYEELVALAKEYGHGDLLVGLYYIKLNRNQFRPEILAVFDQFMNEGARMFEPKESEYA